MPDNLSFQTKVLQGQVAITDDNGNLTLHRHEDDGTWFDFQRDKVVDPCPHCEAGVPLANYIVRYIIDERTVYKHVYLGADIIRCENAKSSGTSV